MKLFLQRPLSVVRTVFKPSYVDAKPDGLPLII